MNTKVALEKIQNIFLTIPKNRNLGFGIIRFNQVKKRERYNLKAETISDPEEKKKFNFVSGSCN